MEGTMRDGVAGAKGQEETIQVTGRPRNPSGPVEQEAEPGAAKSAAEEALALLGTLPAGSLYLRLDAGSVTLRNAPVVLWRGESGRAGGEDALKLVFEDETSLNLSRILDCAMDPQGRVLVRCAGATATFGARPW